MRVFNTQSMLLFRFTTLQCEFPQNSNSFTPVPIRFVGSGKLKTAEMKQKITQKSEPLLEVLKRNTTEIWCMVSVRENQIINSSQSFLTLWGFSATPPDASDSSPSDVDSEMVVGTGVLADVLPTLSVFIQLVQRNDTSLKQRLMQAGVSVAIHDVFDQQGELVGQLVFFKTTFVDQSICGSYPGRVAT